MTWGNLIVWIFQILNCKQLNEPRVLVNAEESSKPIETQYLSDHNVCVPQNHAMVLICTYFLVSNNLTGH